MRGNRVYGRRATEDDPDFLRETRNLVRHNMTRDDKRLTHEDQVAWWATDPAVWIFEDGWTARVGYAVVSPKLPDGRNYISLAVVPHLRGRGIGTQIYAHFHPTP